MVRPPVQMIRLKAILVRLRIALVRLRIALVRVSSFLSHSVSSYLYKHSVLGRCTRYAATDFAQLQPRPILNR
jgi:hypothetical protein